MKGEKSSILVAYSQIFDIILRMTARPLHRRDFLARCAAAPVAAAGGRLSRLHAQPTRRPNVLFLICDDLNDSVEGLGGHPQAKTPNFNRLARRSVTFTNAHNSQPSCAPSRASLWSGLHPFTTHYHFPFDRDILDRVDPRPWSGDGHWRTNPVLRDTVTAMEHFKKNGYAVYGTGKVFHNGHEDKSVYTEYKYDADFGPWPWDGKQRRENPHLASLFDTHYFRTQTNLYDSPHSQTFGPLSQVPRFAPDPAAGTPGFDGWYLGGKPFRYVSETDRDHTPDELSADWAVEVLRQRHDRPFFLAVGFNRPHVPLYAPKKYFDLFPLDQIQLPPGYRADDLWDCARALMQNNRKGLQNFRLLHAAGGEDMWKRWVQAYLACVAFADDQAGKVLGALDDSPYARDTIVIVTGDHGFHMGEKDWIHKNSLWDVATQVPLIVNAPGIGRPGSRCDHPVSLIDMYPTLIDLCGLPEDPNADGNGRALDGHSIRPFLADPENGSWDGPPVAVTTVGFHDTAHYSARGRRWRYTWCSTGEEELYDHNADPHEWTNLAGDPAHAEIKNRLHRELMSLVRK